MEGVKEIGVLHPDVESAGDDSLIKLADHASEANPSIGLGFVIIILSHFGDVDAIILLPNGRNDAFTPTQLEHPSQTQQQSDAAMLDIEGKNTVWSW